MLSPSFAVAAEALPLAVHPFYIYPIRKMAKKQQTAGDGAKRMNFLYQASALFAERKYGKVLGRQLKLVSQKLVLRMDPSIKRTLCKSCCAVLISGVNSTISLDEDEKLIKVTCDSCHTVKAFPTLKIKPAVAP